MANAKSPRTAEVKKRPTREKRKKTSKRNSSPRETDDANQMTFVDRKSLFPILDLPAELRNAIYEYAALDATAVVRPNVRGKVLSNSPLTRVSHQVREEYSSMLLLTAPTITAHVKDLDFAHIVALLNRLSDQELRALPSITLPSDRSIRINLHITEACATHSDTLTRWLLRLEHPTKSGTNLNITYRALGIHHFTPSRPYDDVVHSWASLNPAVLAWRANKRAVPQDGSPVGAIYQALKKMLPRVEKEESAGRIKEELKKIIEALRFSASPAGSYCACLVHPEDE
ncbi:hypothetical protein LTR78_010064 [Recurvomyces mirabilis]|uniref:Uncharacterized protein n=1 Tax=Recurvomyces mirabilis TaxID=574656 RepID=A0AAE0TMS7_9PEZI|nr:hypothetical protein LTR78_010064 [Recurvomyces mirabilis]KAK5159830.1 hypothetical protein LTS14_001935 [Recurvomyces mirabilis]